MLTLQQVCAGDSRSISQVLRLASPGGESGFAIKMDVSPSAVRAFGHECGDCCECRSEEHAAWKGSCFVDLLRSASSKSDGAIGDVFVQLLSELHTCLQDPTQRELEGGALVYAEDELHARHERYEVVFQCCSLILHDHAVLL